MEISEIENFYADGKRELTAIMEDGSKMNLRLFKSTHMELCYYGKNMKRRGYTIRHVAERIVSLTPKKSRTNLSRYERYIDSLEKFKNAFTKKVHKNLWSGMQDGYKRLDIEAFKKFVEAGEYNSGNYYDALREFSKGSNLDLMWENHYKTTTIKSNRPLRGRMSGGYYECVEKIKSHLDNKEDFSYYWESNYDVHVSGHTSKNGEYRATLSLEYRGCGNGHYYILINENQAVFGEDD